MGIEPTLVAWEATVLPLNYTRSQTPILCRFPMRGKLRPEPAGGFLAPQDRQSLDLALLLDGMHDIDDVQLVVEITDGRFQATR